MGAIVVLSLLLLQEEATIPKAQKAAYLKAVKECERAGGEIESDPRGVIEVIDSILGNKKIRTREVRLRIQLSGGSYSRWYDFFPYQFRGRARLVLAKMEEEGDVALDLLRHARRDIEESVNRGVNASKEYLKKIETERKRWEVSTPPADPEPDFRREWNDLLARDRFVQAKTLVKEKGGFLPEVKRAEYISKTEEACRTMVTNRLKVFLLRLEKVRRPEDVTTMGSATFLDTFSLPDKAHLFVPSPVLDWCIAVRETLGVMRRRGEVLDSLLAHGVASVSLVEKGENGWFRSMEELAFGIVSDRLGKLVVGAKNAPAPRREVLRDEGEALRRKWKEFERAAGRLSNGRDVTSWEANLPVEAKGIEKIPDDLFSCAEVANPLEAVMEMKERLRKYRDQWDRLSIESRRLIVRYQIIAEALGHFLEGRTVVEATRGLRTRGRELKSLGGSFDVQRFGLKVESVFQGLR